MASPRPRSASSLGMHRPLRLSDTEVVVGERDLHLVGAHVHLHPHPDRTAAAGVFDDVGPDLTGGDTDSTRTSSGTWVLVDQVCSRTPEMSPRVSDPVRVSSASK